MHRDILDLLKKKSRSSRSLARLLQRDRNAVADTCKELAAQARIVRDGARWKFITMIIREQTFTIDTARAYVRANVTNASAYSDPDDRFPTVETMIARRFRDARAFLKVYDPRWLATLDAEYNAEWFAGFARDHEAKVAATRAQERDARRERLSQRAGTWDQQAEQPKPAPNDDGAPAKPSRSLFRYQAPGILIEEREDGSYRVVEDAGYSGLSPAEIIETLGQARCEKSGDLPKHEAGMVHAMNDGKARIWKEQSR
jgi:hypothetical protein